MITWSLFSKSDNAVDDHDMTELANVCQGKRLCICKKHEKWVHKQKQNSHVGSYMC
jgi:hypothetical protein